MLNTQAEPPEIPELTGVVPIAVIGEYLIRRIDDSVPFAVRRVVANVAYAALSDMPNFKIGYDGSSTSDQLRMYVVTTGISAVAMATVATSRRNWRLRWMTDKKACLLSVHADQTPRPRIGQLWVASTYRRLRIAEHLLDQICSTEGVLRSELGLQLPFSSHGLQFVRSFATNDWYADGDLMELESVLADPVICAAARSEVDNSQ